MQAPLVSASSQVRRYGHWIDGQPVATATHIQRVGPQSDDVVAEFSNGSDSDAARAIQSARRAFDEGPWPKLSGTERANVLNRWADLVLLNLDHLVQIEIAEAGKTIRVAKGDLEGTVALMRYAAALCHQLSGEAFTDFGSALQAMVIHEPVGVVAAIVPWNFPTIIFAQKVPFALAAGCTVVVKPSELTSGTAYELARLATQAGLPNGALNVVMGYGDPVGQHLVQSQDVDMVSFTGSTATGRRVLKGQEVNFKRVSLELGGKSAAIVFDDCDIEAAVEGVLFSIFMHSGQLCCAGSRLLVQNGIAPRFLEALIERAEQLKIGLLEDPSTDFGPVVSEVQLQSLKRFVARAKAQGATILSGGDTADSRSESATYVGASRTFLPTILDNVECSMEVFDEEAFGPILSVTRFATEDEAVRLANMSKYGLAGSVWTTNMRRAFDIAGKVRTGTMEINTSLEGQPQLPFGGFRTSGIGREKGKAGLEEFTEIKTVAFRLEARPPFFGAK
ncbi:aldehyde dehydrogenase [Paraburkholderia sp. EG285A]|uniref:aldehyde dehydrogenase n=1 Tax=Paraburkholderia sp. EG285A TaxID=3237009 RepID=UPI0034D27212